MAKVGTYYRVNETLEQGNIIYVEHERQDGLYKYTTVYRKKGNNFDGMTLFESGSTFEKSLEELKPDFYVKVKSAKKLKKALACLRGLGFHYSLDLAYDFAGECERGSIVYIGCKKGYEFVSFSLVALDEEMTVLSYKEFKAIFM